MTLRSSSVLLASSDGAMNYGFSQSVSLSVSKSASRRSLERPYSDDEDDDEKVLKSRASHCVALFDLLPLLFSLFSSSLVVDS